MAHPTRQRHRNRAWIIYLLIGTIVFGATLFLTNRSHEDEEVAPNITADSSFRVTGSPEPDRVATTAPATSPSTSTRVPASQPTTAPAPVAKPVVIPQSIATQVYIPAADRALVINSKVKPLNCRPIIDPPLDGYVYNCRDFPNPGTNAPGTTVLAGHSSNYMDTALNSFFRQDRSLDNREVWVRTKASGSRWLVYGIHAVYHVDKPSLATNTAIWGDRTTSTAGRLVIVTCLQREVGKKSVQNFVAVAQFKGVR